LSFVVWQYARQPCWGRGYYANLFRTISFVGVFWGWIWAVIVCGINNSAVYWPFICYISGLPILLVSMWFWMRLEYPLIFSLIVLRYQIPELPIQEIMRQTECKYSQKLAKSVYYTTQSISKLLDELWPKIIAAKTKEEISQRIRELSSTIEEIESLDKDIISTYTQQLVVIILNLKRSEWQDFREDSYYLLNDMVLRAGPKYLHSWETLVKPKIIEFLLYERNYFHALYLLEYAILQRVRLNEEEFRIFVEVGNTYWVNASETEKLKVISIVDFLSITGSSFVGECGAADVIVKLARDSSHDVARKARYCLQYHLSSYVKDQSALSE